jgi:GDP-L-fucose synthase
LIKNSLDWSDKKVLVTGGNGFLGSHVVNELKNLNVKDVFTPASKDYDLRNRTDCKKVLKDIDVVFHLASTSGGIMFLKERPAEAFYDNIMMGVNLIHEAKEAGIEKLIITGAVSSYPKLAPIPFNEKNIWDGYPDETNAPYGIAKRTLLVQSQAYRQQFDFNSIILFLTNLYGPKDHFDPTSATVIPALIHKISSAKKQNDKSISIWGDGTPTRDFLYVQDAVRGLMLAAEKYDEGLPINLGSDQEITINELVNLISEIIDFKGQIKWDKSKPNGQPRRKVSNKLAEEKLGFKAETTLEEGLQKTIEWFQKHITN